MIKDNSVVVVSDDLTVADLDGEAVILDQKEGVYYGLNEVGTHVLKLIERPRVVQDVLDLMAEEYDVGLEQLRNDVLDFLNQLNDNDLVRVTDEIPA